MLRPSPSVSTFSISRPPIGPPAPARRTSPRTWLRSAAHVVAAAVARQIIGRRRSRVRVARQVVRRGVERLVRVPHVDPQHEPVLVRFSLQPVHRRRDRPAAHPVPLVAPLGRVAQIAVDRRLRLDLARAAGSAPRSGGQVAVAVLAAPDASPRTRACSCSRRCRASACRRSGPAGSRAPDDLRQHDVVRLEGLPTAGGEAVAAA